MDFNFGLFNARRTPDNDIEVTLTIKNKEDKVKLEKKFLKSKHMTIDPKKQRYSHMCFAIHEKGEKVLQLSHYAHALIEGKSPVVMSVLGAFIALLCVPATSVVRIVVGIPKRRIYGQSKKTKKE